MCVSGIIESNLSVLLGIVEQNIEERAYTELGVQKPLVWLV